MVIFKALRLADPQVLVEQLRLIYSNLTFTIPARLPSMILPAWTFFDHSNRQHLKLGAAVLTAANVYLIFNARHQLKLGLKPAHARRLVYQLMVLLAMGGSLWGVLALQALGGTAAIGIAIVISVLAVRAAVKLRFETTELLEKTEIAQKEAEQANAIEFIF